jgi:hypothetical protein
MNKLQEAFLRYLSAEETKVQARVKFEPMKIVDGLEDFLTARAAFQRADGDCEEAAAVVMAVMQELRADDELGDAVEALGEKLKDFTRFAEQRGLTQFVAASSSSLSNLTKRWRNAAAAYTAFLSLNDWRGRLALEEFEAVLGSEACPSNVDPSAWSSAKIAFSTRLDEYNEETDYNKEPETAMADVAHELKIKALRAYDRVTEQYVTVLRDLQEGGRLGDEMSRLDAALLPILRDALTRVPQLQRQTETSPAPRPVITL